MAANVDSFILSEVTKFIFDDHEIWEFLRRQAEATKNILKKIIVKGIQFLTKSINKKVARKADLIVVINER